MPTDGQMERAMQLDPSFNSQLMMQQTSSNWMNPAASGYNQKDSITGTSVSSYFPNLNSGVTVQDKVKGQNTKLEGHDAKSLEDANLNLAMVEDILRKTSQAVNDLDNFLKFNGEVEPVRE